MKKLPTIKSLQVEFAERLNEKKAAYAELKKVRDELRDLAVHTANYEELRDLEEREKRKEQGAVKEPNDHSQPHYNFISSKPMKEKNA